MAAALFPKPAVSVEAPAGVDIALRRTPDGKLSVHLMNRLNTPVSNQYGIIDFIPSIGPIQLKMRVPDRPRAIRWVPDSQELNWSWADGMLTVNVPTLHVHGVLVVD
jgi:hypothetical protein